MPALAQLGKENEQTPLFHSRRRMGKTEAKREAVTPWAQVVRQGRNSQRTPGLATSFGNAVALQTPHSEPSRSAQLEAAAEKPAGLHQQSEETSARSSDASSDACSMNPSSDASAAASNSSGNGDGSLVTAHPSPSSSPRPRPVKTGDEGAQSEASRMVTAADILREGGSLDASAPAADAPAGDADGSKREVASPGPVSIDPAQDEGRATQVERPQTPPPRDLLMSPSKRQSDVRSPPADQRTNAGQSQRTDASRPSSKKPRSDQFGNTWQSRSSRPQQQRHQQLPRQSKKHSAGVFARKNVVKFDFSRAAYVPLPEAVLAVLDASCNTFVKKEVERAMEMDQPACELTAQLQAAVSTAWPGAAIICYGSRATGLAGAASDVDLVVVGAHDLTSDPNPSVETQLQALRKILPCLDSLAVKASIQKSTVPIIALEVTEGAAAGLKVDISVHTSRHSGIAAAQNVRWLQTGLPALRPLTLMLKELLRQHDLKSTYTGGLSSYALTNMVALFLLMSPMLRAEREAHAAAGNRATPPSLPTSPTGTSVPLATLLLELLHFYGSIFDPAVHALGWDRGHQDEPVVVVGRRHNCGPLAAFEQDPLIIFDPLNATNNIGKSCYRFSLVQQVFRNAATAARAAAAAAAESACDGVPPDREEIVAIMLAAANSDSSATANVHK